MWASERNAPGKSGLMSHGHFAEHGNALPAAPQPLGETPMKKSAISIATALTLSAASVAAGAASGTDLLGSAVQPSSVNRTVSIDSGTRWVNVRQGEVVGFVSNGQEFAWQFD